MSSTSAGDEGASAIRILLEDARKKLIETGTRNRLIHVNRSNQRANALNIVDEKSDSVFNILFNQKKRMRFHAQGSDEDQAGADSESGLVLLEDLSEDFEFDNTRYDDNMLETRLSPDKLQKRLLKLNKDSQVAEQEQGVNILFLALGFLTWYEDKSSAMPREAPLILLPVELVRNDRTAMYDIKCRDDDLVTNMSLQQRLSGDFGIELPEIEVDDGWSPGLYFEKVADKIETKTNWKIDENGMQLGFFSFSKLLMLRDLDPQNWPSGSLENNTLLHGLLRSGIFKDEGPLFGADIRLDEALKPADLIQVVDADASQTKVIEEVRAGRNLVVEGPPGTGKSQTITNIIAAAAHDGKRVLFMAEKMAALNVVHKKLVDVDLETICLELHSRSANKKAMLEELGKTIQAASTAPSEPEPPLQLTKIRDELNSLSRLIHTPIAKTEETPYEVMGWQSKMIGLNIPPPVTYAGDSANVPKSVFLKLISIVREYSERLSDYGRLDNHPLFGIANLDLQPIERERLLVEVPKILRGLKDLRMKCAESLEALGLHEQPSFQQCVNLVKLVQSIGSLPEVNDEILVEMIRRGVSDRMLEGLNTGARLRKEKSEQTENFIDAAWDYNVTHIHMAVSAGETSFWSRIGSKYRKAGKELSGLISVPLPKSPTERLKLVRKLIDIQKLAQELSDEETYLSDRFGIEWRGEKTPFDSLLSAARWVNSISAVTAGIEPGSLVRFVRESSIPIAEIDQIDAEIRSLCTEVESMLSLLRIDIDAVFSIDVMKDVPLVFFEHKFDQISQNIDKYADWAQVKRLEMELEKNGLDDLKRKIESGEMDADEAENELRYSRAEAIWKYVRTNRPLPQSAFNRAKTVAEFHREGRERIRSTRRLIKSRHLKQVPRGAEGPMGVVRSEIGKRRRHLPIRRLMQNAADAVQRIKPVFLMSPISISQFLPPGKVEFDVLVIDEASQVKPEDALGAIARSKQLVVVGDQKQMPPSAFFDRMTSNEDAEENELLGGAAKATELESILTLCEARGLGGNPRMLEWHYRSRDPSLITVSNREFYKGNLILPPSPLQDDDNYGLRLIRVDGVYDRGAKNNVNSIEAQAVVDRVADHARQNPELSLGIATFSTVQRNHINELLEYSRRSDPILDGFLREGRSEDVFVKNLENVQGDERDVILISVGYGPSQPGGVLQSMHFGPVNSDGGERRLNVLFTRSRIRCEIFCSFDPADIDLSRTSALGPRILKQFLEYAKTGLLRDEEITGLGAESPLEEDVAREIHRLGYEFEQQVGSAGFRIDIGVRHKLRKGQFICAVECDGASYHSALWARERDRLRQEVLEHLGWRFHRVWSTDWFQNRQVEIQKLADALQAASDAADSGIKVEGANKDGFLDIDPQEEPDETPPSLTELELSTRRLPPYKRYSHLGIISDVEPHEAPLITLTNLIYDIVNIEGPIHESEMVRRVAECFGKKRTGARIQSAVLKAIKGCTELKRQQGFLYTSGQESDPPVRDRSDETGYILKGEMLPPIEIRAAMKLAEEDNGILDPDDAVRAIAKLFGFRRVGSDLNAAISEVIKENRN